MHRNTKLHELLLYPHCYVQGVEHKRKRARGYSVTEEVAGGSVVKTRFCDLEVMCSNPSRIELNVFF